MCELSICIYMMCDCAEAGHPYGEALILPGGLQGSKAIHQPCLSGNISKVTPGPTYS